MKLMSEMMNLKLLTTAFTHPMLSARLSRIWSYLNEVKAVLDEDLKAIEEKITGKYGEDVDKETAEKAGQEYIIEALKLVKGATVKEIKGRKALIVLLGERRKIRITVIYEVVE